VQEELLVSTPAGKWARKFWLIQFFQQLTSAGGGGGGNSIISWLMSIGAGLSGGSGGGGGAGSVPTVSLQVKTGGAGNTPPVSPSQGNNGGTGVNRL
jgi:hypothetical protein